MKYEFRTTNGQVCCSGDEIAHLCSACREKARVSSPGPGASGVVPRHSATSPVPPPPDLVAAIRHKRRAASTLAGRRRFTVADRQAEIRKYFAVRQPMANGERP